VTKKRYRRRAPSAVAHLRAISRRIAGGRAEEAQRAGVKRPRGEGLLPREGGRPGHLEPEYVDYVVEPAPVRP